MTLDELEMIAELCRKHDVIVLSDEVYEWFIYPPHQHIRIGLQHLLFFARTDDSRRSKALSGVCLSVILPVSVCVALRTITQKRMIAKSSNLV